MAGLGWVDLCPWFTGSMWLLYRKETIQILELSLWELKTSEGGACPSNNLRHLGTPPKTNNLSQKKLFSPSSWQSPPQSDAIETEEQQLHVATDTSPSRGIQCIPTLAGWSLGRDMSTQAHSMLGVAMERWGVLTVGGPKGRHVFFIFWCSTQNMQDFGQFWSHKHVHRTTIIFWITCAIKWMFEFSWVHSKSSTIFIQSLLLETSKFQLTPDHHTSDLRPVTEV